ncbi:MAG: HAMP domain-containing histidine kinase [Flavobacteriales bacterium]|jgi:two-component system phosphate regulon sensor histidine kinase PhoR|nr:HAMP domain-containing histidine kinase [Flavobacteriales bacterium]
MGRRAIGTLMLLATLSVVGVVLTQLIWLRQSSQYRKEQVALNKEQASQLEKQFNDRVVMALGDVTEQILTINKDSTDLYDAVKQMRPNYFAVTINDTLHPYLLEALLRKEFSRRHIEDDFEYGIYDCFTDSIVYGNYVSQDTAISDTMPHSELPKLDKDGHYFGVYFPTRQSTLWDEENDAGWTWIFPTVVTLIVFSFFAYSVWVIMRQKRLSEMKNDFIGNMTHELKTPISTIALSSEVISDPAIVQEPERLREYARIIRSENERLRTQVERVLQLATLDKDSVAMKREAVDMHLVATAAAESIKLPAQERDMRVELHLDAAISTVAGDRVHLTNALFNLLDNAVKYGKPGTVIEVRSSQRGNELLLSVKDEGIGIRKEDQRHVFERFYRVPTGNVHDVKGFGLGLHYVQQIAFAHGGGVSVRSEPGKGSVFTLSLPLRGRLGDAG